MKTLCLLHDGSNVVVVEMPESPGRVVGQTGWMDAAPLMDACEAAVANFGYQLLTVGSTVQHQDGWATTVTVTKPAY